MVGSGCTTQNAERDIPQIPAKLFSDAGLLLHLRGCQDSLGTEAHMAILAEEEAEL